MVESKGFSCFIFTCMLPVACQHLYPFRMKQLPTVSQSTKPAVHCKCLGMGVMSFRSSPRLGVVRIPQGGMSGDVRNL